MIPQILPNLCYALLILATSLAPYLATMRKAALTPSRLLGSPVYCGILALACALTGARLGALMAVSMILLLPALGRGARFLLGGISAMLLFAPTTWWTGGVAPDPVPSITFILICVSATILLRWKTSPSFMAEGLRQRASLTFSFIAFALIGLATGLLTAPFGSASTAFTAWHHWGAYVSPAEAWLSGGVPYRDFPIQYGLGPTLLLAGSCGSDCWQAMYWLAVVANALYFATLGGTVMLLSSGLARGFRIVAIAALFCATFLWTAFPSNVAGPVMTPSVAGLRFLTISALLFHIVLAEHRQKRRDWIGHLIWLVDLAWSPESAFFGTLIWWPYLALRDITNADRPLAALIALCHGALRGVIALIAALCLFAIALWSLSHGGITPTDFFAYIQHPPGRLPINPVGAIWLALAVIGLGLHALFERPTSPQARSLYASLLGLLAAGSYFLSRSHDNNILNLFPLLVLVLLAMAAVLDGDETPRSDFAKGFVQTALIAMIAFVTTFNFGPWREGALRDGAFNIGPERLIRRFAPTHDTDIALLHPDAVRSLEYLRSRKGGGVVMIDDRYVIPRSPAGTGWTGVNNGANFAPLPRAFIVRYIQRGAISYHRPGWLLLDFGHFGHWLELFHTAYDVREEKRFGTYRAYFLVPRTPRIDAPR